MTVENEFNEFLIRGFFESYLFNISINSTCTSQISIQNTVEIYRYNFYNILRKLKKGDLLRCIKYIYSQNDIQEPDYIIELCIQYVDVSFENSEFINTYKEYLHFEDLPFILYLYDTYESLLLAIQLNKYFWEAYDRLAYFISIYQFKINKVDGAGIYSFINFDFPCKIFESMFYIRLFLSNEHYQYNIIEYLNDMIVFCRSKCQAEISTISNFEIKRKTKKIERKGKKSEFKFYFTEPHKKEERGFAFCFCKLLRNLLASVFYKLKLLKIATVLLQPNEELSDKNLFYIKSPLFLSSIIDILYLNGSKSKIIQVYNDLKIMQKYFLGAMNMKNNFIEDESHLSILSDDTLSSRIYNTTYRLNGDDIFKGDHFFTPLKLYAVISFEQLNGKTDLLEYVISKKINFPLISKIKLIYIQDLIKRGEYKKLETFFSYLENKNNLFTDFLENQFNKCINLIDYKILYAYYRIYGTEKYLTESIELKEYIDIFIRQYVNNKFYKNILFGDEKGKNFIFTLNYSDCKNFNFNIFKLKNIKNYTKEFLLSLTKDYRLKIEGDIYFAEKNYTKAIEKYLQVRWRPIRKLLKKYLKLK